MHITVYEHFVNLAIKENERKRNGGQGKRGEEKGERHARSLPGARGLSPHEPP